MKLTNRIILASLLSMALIAGCSSGPERSGGRGGPSEGKGQFSDRQDVMRQLDGAYIAMPTALVLTSYDSDRDSMITHDELKSGAEKEWLRMDLGEDGSVTLIDLSRWAEANLGNSKARPGYLSFDRNGDGNISQTEVTQQLTEEFSNADKNKDGIVTRAELVRQLNMPQIRQQKRGQGGMPNGQGGRGSGRGR